MPHIEARWRLRTSPACAADDLVITTQYRHDCRVVFGIDSDGDGFLDAVEKPALEAIGGAGDGPFGFNNNVLGQIKDTADPGFEAQLGSLFLRGEVPLAPVTLVILYDAPVAAASGEIWDIDGAPAEGTEQWRVEAMGASHATGTDPNDVVAAIDSPIGTDTSAVGLAFDDFSPSQPAAAAGMRRTAPSEAGVVVTPRRR